MDSMDFDNDDMNGMGNGDGNGGDDYDDYSIISSVLALALVVGSASIGGMLVALLNGWHFDKLFCIPALYTKPIIKKIAISPLIGMILMGCIAINTYGKATEPYVEKWSKYIREIALCLLLVRGGMTITLKGKGLMVVIISFVP